MTARKAAHLIGDIHYEPANGPSWLVCDTDGAQLNGPTPDALVDVWIAHGGKGDRDGWRRALTTESKAKPRCAFEGCIKGPAKVATAVVPGYCMEHGYIVAGIPPKRYGVAPGTRRAHRATRPQPADHRELAYA